VWLDKLARFTLEQSIMDSTATGHLTCHFLSVTIVKVFVGLDLVVEVWP
jgi:hypothetical protein